MARPIWAGSISFGLVNIPVKLFTAVRQQEVQFNMLHKTDGARIKMKRFCSLEDKEVAYEDTAKGYEVSPGSYVSIDRKELEKLDPKATRTIEISDFVELQEIDPIFYESTYHLIPDRGATRAYGLLLEAMRRAKKVGIGRMVMRTKQYLCAVRPLEQGLVISTMQYAEEIVPQEGLEGLPAKGAKVADRELEMAEQIIDSLTVKFDPEKYKDEYSKRVMQLIKAKAAGEVIRPAPPEKRAEVVNLMDALKKSLAQAQSGAGGSEEREEASGEKRAPGQRAAREGHRPASNRRPRRAARKGAARG